MPHYSQDKSEHPTLHLIDGIKLPLITLPNKQLHAQEFEDTQGNSTKKMTREIQWAQIHSTSNWLLSPMWLTISYVAH